ncbi:hypothetical protein ILYODFUR_030387 [Ilyodon furcidens]|uniref:Uncharacterized protein n=1 Tax=Ilyodon furcidens TaxID=33524 RepID=A0ABV0UML1_9TELE
MEFALRVFQSESVWGENKHNMKICFFSFNNNNNNLDFIDLTMEKLSLTYPYREQCAAIVRCPGSIQGLRVLLTQSDRLCDLNQNTCGLSGTQMPCSLTIRPPLPLFTFSKQ